jgi:hypothetical protein
MNKSLPEFFKPILWSYDFDKLDKERDKDVIIINAINYGDLIHWRWLKDNYNVSDVLSKIPATAIRKRARKLAKIIFRVEALNYAQRGIISK